MPTRGGETDTIQSVFGFFSFSFYKLSCLASKCLCTSLPHIILQSCISTCQTFHHRQVITMHPLTINHQTLKRHCTRLEEGKKL